MKILILLISLTFLSCTTAPKKSPCPDDLCTNEKYDQKLKSMCIGREIRRNYPKLQKCYNDSLQNAPSKTNGISIVDFVIGPSGTVTSFKQDSLTDVSGPFDSCLQEVFMKMTFPKAPVGDTVKVKQPINFINNKEQLQK